MQMIKHNLSQLIHLIEYLKSYTSTTTKQNLSFHRSWHYFRTIYLNTALSAAFHQM